MGTILAAEYRNGITPLLTEKESKLSFMWAGGKGQL
jgi:hypothetical protein